MRSNEIILTKEQADELWKVAHIFHALPNVLLAIRTHKGGWFDEFTREEFFEALADDWDEEQEEHA